MCPSRTQPLTTISAVKKKKAEIMQADNRTYTIDYEGMEKMNGLFILEPDGCTL